MFILNSKEKLINIVNHLPDDALKDILKYIELHYQKEIENDTDLESYYDEIISEDREVLKRLSE
jgi:hypothetical protein